jgi:acyl carrier protein
VKKATDPKMPFDEFRSLLAEELMLPVEKVTPEAQLVEDLQVDSLAMVSMMLTLEESGINIPMERAWEMQTVEDAYRAYTEGLGAQA